jgi:hypothetical protein
MEVMFATDSPLRKINAFQKCKSLNRLEIPASVEEIDSGAFSGCSRLTEVIKEISSRLRKINGFQGCGSLSRAEVPSSVEQIGLSAFFGCSRLREVIFPTNGRLKRICGFEWCPSLSRLDIPASVEKICCSEDEYASGFLGDVSRRELMFGSGMRVQPNAKEGNFRGFVIFEDENDLKRRRRQAHV